ncbi:hypothetical protein N9924_00640 [bacterium]|nr:hypothetical protein [bacterium]
MKLFVLPYKQGSKSATHLAKGIGAKRIRLERSKFAGGDHTGVINWGCSDIPDVVRRAGRIFNKPDNIKIASNKLSFFREVSKVEGINLPDFTTDKKEAIEWDATIVARHKLQGHSGEGIVLCEPDEDFDEAPLYVRYIPKRQEYRVHVFNGKIMDTQRKARRNDVAKDDVNWRVRNHGNGFIFARNEDMLIPHDLYDQAIKAVEACGLDFGAVDLIWNEKRDKCYVLEINTAPGLEGTTLDNYINAFKEINNG